MRVACVFDSFHEDNNRSDPFVFAEFFSAITAMPSADKGVEVAKRSVIFSNGCLHVGAVGYPYSQDNKEIAFQEVKAVKSANLTFRCVRNTDGVIVPVRYDKKSGMYISPDDAGEFYRERDIQHRYYDSSILKKEEDRLLANESLQTCQDYVNWARSVRGNKRVLDIGIPAGRDMSSCVDDVYFGSYTPSRVVSLPEFYLRTRQVVTFRDNAIENYMLKAARKEADCFAFEYAPGKGVVTAVLVDGDFVYVDFTKAVSKDDPDNPGKKIWVATDKVDTIEFPNHKGTTQVLIEPTPYEAGKTIDMEHLLNYHSRLVRVIPFNPAYSNYNAVVSAVGEATIQWITQRVIDQHRPVIRGVQSIALSFLGDMPNGVSSRDFFARNRRVTSLFECEPIALVQELNPFVKIDLLHHYWFRPFNKSTAVATQTANG